MTMEERAEMAGNLKATGQCNCAQAVLRVFEDKLPLNEQSLDVLGAGFGAGMGCMEATCGALVGAVMVAGYLTNGQGTTKVARKMISDFNEKCGATICKHLKGVGTGKVLCECPDCCKNAVLTLNCIQSNKE